MNPGLVVKKKMTRRGITGPVTRSGSLSGVAFIYILLFSVQLHASDPVSDLTERISSDSLLDCVSSLASDVMEGRETGRRGQKLAAEFLSAKFSSCGLKPLPGQKDLIIPHALSLRANEGSNIEVHQKHFLYLEDFLYIPGHQDTILQLGELLFAGFGISEPQYDDYRDLEIQGKAIMILEGIPDTRASGNKRLRQDAFSDWETDWKKKFSLIYEKRPSVVFIVSKNIQQLADSLLDEQKAPEFYRLARSPSAIPIVFVSENMALNFFPEHEQHVFERAKSRVFKNAEPSSFISNTDAGIRIRKQPGALYGENVAGMIRGAGSPEEYVFIIAHYDHLGIKDSLIRYGADDNASGVAALCEMARIFSSASAEGSKPVRSIVFIAFSGEEKGMLGSSYFSDHPPLPLKNITAVLNMDMLGRTDSLHDSLGVKEYVYVIGARRQGDELFRINEEANQSGPGLLLNYRYDAPDEPNGFYYRSDHFHFAKHGIPVIFYFNGIHADYHKPGDTVDKIDKELLAKRTRLIFRTAWKLAEGKKKIGKLKRAARISG
jgi:hypothetical protein